MMKDDAGGVEDRKKDDVGDEDDAEGGDMIATMLRSAPLVSLFFSV